MRQCLGCRRPFPKNDGNSRCPSCRAERQRQIDADPARRQRKAVLYNAAHRRLRQAWAPYVAAGTVVCGDCRQPIAPTDEWDLGHSAGTESTPWHQKCNRADGAAIANTSKEQK